MEVSIYRTSEKRAGIFGLRNREERLAFQETVKPHIKGCRYQPKFTRGFYSFPLDGVLEAVMACTDNGITVNKVFIDKVYH